MTSVTDHLTSGCVSNLFLVKEGKLITPRARGEETVGDWPAAVLPGITRSCLIDIAQTQGIEVEKMDLTTSDLADADEVFMTNSSWGLLPITQVQNHAIGDGHVGPISQHLIKALDHTIQIETA